MCLGNRCFWLCFLSFYFLSASYSAFWPQRSGLIFSPREGGIGTPVCHCVYHCSGLLPSGMLRQLKRCFCDMIFHFFRLLCTAPVSAAVRFVKFYLPVNGNISLA